MSRINVMVNGIPGNMAVNVAEHILADDRFALVPCSLTGPEIQEAEYNLEAISIRLLQPEIRDGAIENSFQTEGAFISVAGTSCRLSWAPPAAIASNWKKPCSHQRSPQ